MIEPTYITVGSIALIYIDNPPVNALAQPVRAHLVAAVTAAEADPSVAALVLLGRNAGFSAGADIREFGVSPQAPSLPEVCQHIEDCAKPVLAAIHGNALGGGLEIAMACHYRLAENGARLGLPEVNLGLLPGAGGTQRAPRLMGVKAALELILSGRPINASSAIESGLIDRLADSADFRAAAIAYGEEVVASGVVLQRTRDRVLNGQLANALETLQDARRSIAATSYGQMASVKIVDAVEAAVSLPFNDGMAVERTAFLSCLASPAHAGLAHAFFAERQAVKQPGEGCLPTHRINTVGVVGGGTMGVGIALALLSGGLQVIMIERDSSSLARARAIIVNTLEGQVAKGRITLSERDSQQARLSGDIDYAAVSEVDMVIEAVFEDLEIKKKLFALLDRICKPNAILATNTSYLDITAMAAETRRPGQVIGLHFFSPANIMKLLEIVVPELTSTATVATAFEFARTLGKLPVRSGVCDGFIGNRLLAVYRQAADHMLEDGASPYQIDRALRDFGYPMGPYEVSDLAGGDIGWATRKRKAATRDPRARYVQIGDRLCERGWFGQKSGRGYYRYEAGTRKGIPDPDVLAIVDSERARAGVKPRSFSDEEIVRRYMAAMINEGARVVEEGIALRPLDVDVALLAGYGFPRFRGGPMKYADMIGLDRVLADVREFARDDPRFWQPTALLIHLAEHGLSFDSMNRSRR